MTKGGCAKKIAGTNVVLLALVIGAWHLAEVIMR
jgi:hypothetical protein